MWRGRRQAIHSSDEALQGETTLRIGSHSVRLQPRVIVLSVLALCSVGLCFLASIMIGDYFISASDVVTVLLGGGSPIERAVVFNLRLGRALVGLVVGAALGYAGALTQSVARNPLASPDILGIPQGASLGAVAFIILGSGHGWWDGLGVSSAAVLGATLAALAIWIISGRGKGGMIQLVLIGVAGAMFLSATTTWLLAKADLDSAAQAQLWLTGSIGTQALGDSYVPGIILLLALMGAGWLGFQLNALTLGEELAHCLGQDVRRAQLMHLFSAVVLTAVAVSVAGPIGFVSFVVPQISRLLARTAHPPIVLSALSGALLLLGADFCARVLIPWELPVGVVTTLLGAPVLFVSILQLYRKATV